MIKINGELASFDRAVNFLNFDKRGNPNGMDSLGIKLEINDEEEHPLMVFIGLKFDVLSVFTNRGASLFVNLEKEHRVYLDSDECYTDWNGPEEEIELYIDVHKFVLNVRQMYSYVYGCASSKSEFNTLLENKVFKTFGKKSARLISMHTTRQFEGNLEMIGFVATNDELIYAVNELLIGKNSLNDEVVYTNWFVPRELKAYEYDAENNEFVFEEGDEYADGLGGVVLTDSEVVNSFSYDRTGFRTGYWDLSLADPFVNAGFRLGEIEHSGTFFTRDKVDGDIDLEMSRFLLEKLSSSTWTDRIFQMLSTGYVVDSELRNPVKTQLNTFKHLNNNIFQDKPKVSWKESMDTDNISVIIDMISAQAGNMNVAPEIRSAAIESFSKTYIPFLFAGNLLRNDYSVTLDDIKDSIVIVYHPVIKKHFFYEVDGVVDTGVSIDENNNVSVTAHGFKYGHESDGEEGIFYWSNIEKLYRDNEKELTFGGNITSEAEREFWFTINPEVTHNMDVLGTRVKAFDDLVYEGNSAYTIAIKKVDLLDIISKEFGVCDSGYVLGSKYGYLEVR